MDILTLRILDLLAEDDEQLEELYLDVNFQIADNVLLAYRERFRLSEIVTRLGELETGGLLKSRELGSSEAQCGPASREYSLTDAGRAALGSHLAELDTLYELA
jgi:DNA-binding PadR family transcriptional regulator